MTYLQSLIKHSGKDKDRYYSLISPLYLATVLGFKFPDPIYDEWEREMLLPYKRKLILKPRGTYKSTLYCVIYPLWLILHDPNIRIILVGLTQKHAKGLMRQVIDLMKHDRFISLFGHYIEKYKQGGFKKYRGDWFDCVRRRAGVKRGHTLTCFGFESGITGSHGDVVIYDDLCDTDDTFSPTIRENKIIIYGQSQGILDPQGREVILGTRKHVDDLYGHIINIINPSMDKEDRYYVSCDSVYNSDCKDGDKYKGEYRYPTRWNKESLQQVKASMGEHIFSHEMRNIPLASGDVLFLETDVDHFNYKEFVRELSIKTGVLKHKANDRFEIGMFIDLAISKKGDYTAVCVGAYDRLDKVLYLLEGVMFRDQPSRLEKEILQLFKKYNGYGTSISKIWIEDNGFQRIIRDMVKDKVRVHDVYCNVRGVTHTKGAGSKESRIRKCQIPWSNGTIKVPLDWRDRMRVFMKQVLEYPTNPHDDAPDALSGLVEAFTKSISNFKIKLV